MTKHRALQLLAALALGVVIGVLGTFGHRSSPPWGLALALVASIGSAVWIRASSGPTPVVVYLVGWVLAVQGLAAGGPGGDVQVVADGTGYTWAYGTVLLILATLWLPRSWFADVAAARKGPRRGLRAAPHDPNVG